MPFVSRLIWVVALLATFHVVEGRAWAQPVPLLIVDIKTKDEWLAGTDDPVSLTIAGFSFPLSDPGRDLLERGETNRFMISIRDPSFTVELIRELRTVTVAKHGDSYFGGGWYFEGITIWMVSANSTPIYQNSAVNKWLDGDDLTWSTDQSDNRWSLPEPRPFPAVRHSARSRYGGWWIAQLRLRWNTRRYGPHLRCSRGSGRRRATRPL